MSEAATTLLIDGVQVELPCSVAGRFVRMEIDLAQADLAGYRRGYKDGHAAAVTVARRHFVEGAAAAVAKAIAGLIKAESGG